jgi:hypothetical protein
VRRSQSRSKNAKLGVGFCQLIDESTKPAFGRDAC